MQPSEDGFTLGGEVSLSRMLSLGLPGGAVWLAWVCNGARGACGPCGLGRREELTPRCVAVTPEGLDLQDKVSQIATECCNFKVTFCLLLSGILKGDKSQTKKKPTPKLNNKTQPTSLPNPSKEKNPTTHKQQKNPQTILKLSFVIVSFPPIAVWLFSFKEEKTKA